jgi:PIN domain nuclease of toxin-antitoxin system
MRMSSAGGSELLLLDTHYWIWLQLGIRTRFPAPLRKAVESHAAHGGLLLSAISVWELGMLEAKGRIRFNSSCAEWVTAALATPGLSLVPLTPEIAVESTRLPGQFHGDPADRIIVATARRMNARLLTRDRKMIAYGRRGNVALYSADVRSA